MAAHARGHVRQRGRRWYVVVDRPRDPLTNKRNQAWLPTDARTRREAERERTRILHELDQGARLDPARITIAEYIERWLTRQARRIKPSSVYTYRLSCQKHVIPDLGTIALASLTADQADEWIARLYKKGLGERRVQNLWTLLRTIMRAALKEKLLLYDPLDAVIAPSFEEVEREVWDAAQTTRFLRLIHGDPDEAIWLTVLYTGLRRGELTALRWQDVDLSGASLTVRQTWARGDQGLYLGTPKSKRSRRSISLPAPLVAALTAQRAWQADRQTEYGDVYEDSGFVFTCPDGRPLGMHTVDTRWRQVRAAAVAAGLPPITFHDLRHVHATVGLDRGVHPKVIQERLGHSSIAITLDRYGHVTRTMQDQATDHYNTAFGPPPDDADEPPAASALPAADR
ncbi:MAG: site-specific integrase [Thermomicrobiales bacterium]